MCLLGAIKILLVTKFCGKNVGLIKNNFQKVSQYFFLVLPFNTTCVLLLSSILPEKKLNKFNICAVRDHMGREMRERGKIRARNKNRKMRSVSA